MQANPEYGKSLNILPIGAPYLDFRDPACVLDSDSSSRLPSARGLAAGLVAAGIGTGLLVPLAHTGHNQIMTDVLPDLTPMAQESTVKPLASFVTTPDHHTALKDFVQPASATLGRNVDHGNDTSAFVADLNHAVKQAQDLVRQVRTQVTTARNDFDPSLVSDIAPEHDSTLGLAANDLRARVFKTVDTAHDVASELHDRLQTNASYLYESAAANPHVSSIVEDVVHTKQTVQARAADIPVLSDVVPVNHKDKSSVNRDDVAEQVSAPITLQEIADATRKPAAVSDVNIVPAAAVSQPAPAAPELVYPTSSHVVTSGFGGRVAPVAGASTYHKGLDFSTGGVIGKPVYAEADGEIVFAGVQTGFGHTVIEDLGKDAAGETVETLDGHLSKILVANHAKVHQGDVIALSGDEGIGTGPHLHNQLMLDTSNDGIANGTPIDPLPYLTGQKHLGLHPSATLAPSPDVSIALPAITSIVPTAILSVGSPLDAIHTVVGGGDDMIVQPVTHTPATQNPSQPNALPSLSSIDPGIHAIVDHGSPISDTLQPTTTVQQPVITAPASSQPDQPGTPYITTPQGEKFVFPQDTTQAQVTSEGPLKWCYTSQTNCHHDYQAADIFAATGTHVLSPVNGTVVMAHDHDNATVGSRVTIRDSFDGSIWYEAHMGDGTIRVKTGDVVQAGQWIGNVGTKEDAQGTQPHTHIDHLPPTYKYRVDCSDAACGHIHFINVQPLLVEAFSHLPKGAEAPTQSEESTSGKVALAGLMSISNIIPTTILSVGDGIITAPTGSGESGTGTSQTDQPAQSAAAPTPAPLHTSGTAPTVTPVSLPSINAVTPILSAGTSNGTVITPTGGDSGADNGSNKDTDPQSGQQNNNQNNSGGSTTSNSQSPSQTQTGSGNSGSNTSSPNVDQLPSNVPQDYRDLLTKAAKAEDTSPVYLDTLFLTENGNRYLPFDTKWATSPRKARGPWQFLDGTFEQYAVDVDGDGKVDRDILDMVDATYAAAHMAHENGVLPDAPLGDLNHPFADPHSMLTNAAKYNWGPGNVQNQTSASTTLTDRHIPTETQNYLKNVAALVQSGFTKSGHPNYGDPRVTS